MHEKTKQRKTTPPPIYYCKSNQRLIGIVIKQVSSAIFKLEEITRSLALEKCWKLNQLMKTKFEVFEKIDSVKNTWNLWRQ